LVATIPLRPLPSQQKCGIIAAFAPVPRTINPLALPGLSAAHEAAMLSWTALPLVYPGMRGEGRGEGGFFEFGQEPLENPVQIFDDIVVPGADHAITERAWRAVAMPAFAAFRVLAAIEHDNRAPLAADPLPKPPPPAGGGRGGG
jgi:hypothetical protein